MKKAKKTGPKVFGVRLEDCQPAVNNKVCRLSIYSVPRSPFTYSLSLFPLLNVFSVSHIIGEWGVLPHDMQTSQDQLKSPIMNYPFSHYPLLLLSYYLAMCCYPFLVLLLCLSFVYEIEMYSLLTSFSLTLLSPSLPSI